MTSQYTLALEPATAAPSNNRQRGFRLLGGAAIAAVPVAVHTPPAIELAIEPAAANAGQVRDIVVRVKNLAKKPLKGIVVNLYGETIGVEAQGETSIATLAPGAEARVRFRAASAVPKLELRASAWAAYGGVSMLAATVEGSGRVLAKADPVSAAMLF